MFAACAATVRALYLAAIVAAVLLVVLTALDLLKSSQPPSGGMFVRLACYVAILSIPATRAGWRLLSRRYLLPTIRLRTRAPTAVLVSATISIGVAATGTLVWLLFFAGSSVDHARGLLPWGLYVIGVYATAAGLIFGEASLAGRSRKRGLLTRKGKDATLAALSSQ